MCLDMDFSGFIIFGILLYESVSLHLLPMLGSFQPLILLILFQPYPPSLLLLNYNDPNARYFVLLP